VSKEDTSPKRLKDRLADQHLLITGATGFLARALVEKILRSLDTVGSLHLLIRPRSDGTSAAERLQRDVLGSSIFDRLRASLGERFDTLWREKVHVVGGDLTRDRFGLNRDEYDALTKRITLVINSAATVTFDERIDLAVELNTRGPQRLLQFARDCGSVPFAHVSTCYVCGLRGELVPEDDSAPQPARELLPRVASSNAYDLDALIDSMEGEALEIRHIFGSDTEVCRRELIQAGMRRARSLGWNDTYTFTKWLGEQLLMRERGDLPVVIFRPAIIEGSFDEPAPGWIDGLRMADPLIVAYGRGKLSEFPAREDIALDLIPVDFVVNGLLAALPIGRPRGREVTIYQSASSELNPLRLRVMLRALQAAFEKRPMTDDRGRPFHPAPLRCVEQEEFLRRWELRKKRLTQLRDGLEAIGIMGRRRRRLTALLRQVEQLIYFAQIYAPYTHLECRFSTQALERLRDKLHPEDVEEFPFDPKRIDWEDYIVNRHVPGLRSFVLGTGGEPTARLRSATMESAPRASVHDALAGKDLFDVFRRAAEEFADKPALQIRRANRWVRYTYEEALHATGTIARRFRERGLMPGARIAVYSESSPEWGLTYLAAMRAGLTVTALDPQLPAEEAWACAEFVGAGLVCTGRSTYEKALQARPEGDAEVVQMVEPFIPPPGASRDALEPPTPMSGSELASILFTSGTTIRPKAVKLTHRNLISNARALVEVHPVYATDEFLSVLPMYHALEFTGGFLVPLAAGATVTYVEQLKGPDIARAMQTTGTTVMLVVPRLLRMFHQAVDTRVAASSWGKRTVFRLLRWVSQQTGGRYGKLLFKPVHKEYGGRLRLFVSGGASLDPDLFVSFAQMGFKVCEGYGLTETSPVLTLNPPDDMRPGSVGVPLPNIELEVRNANLEGIGEIWARGPSITNGYLDNEEATREAFEDGWFGTGDLGRFDGDGYLYITGRAKDLIITGAGKNVYPDEVELCYKDLPHVKELCVLAMPEADGVGDAAHAVVVVDREGTPGADRSSIEREIRSAAEAIGERLPSHQRVAAFHFWERSLPRTTTLKAKRSTIREMLLSDGAAEFAGEIDHHVEELAEQPAEVEGEDDSVTQESIRELLSKHCGKPADTIHPDMHLQLDLGIDSIGRVDVVGAVEQHFAMHIPDRTAAKLARVADLYRVVGERAPVRGGRRDRSAWRRRLEQPSDYEIPPDPMPLSLRMSRASLRGVFSIGMHSWVRVEYHGREYVPKEGAFVVTPNHSSHLDAPAVLVGAGPSRRIWLAGAQDYFFNSRFKRLVFGKLLDTIPFDRRASGMQGLRRCTQALERGDGLLLFPEGTRSLTGAMGKFRIGFAVLAIEEQVPVLPVYVHRAFKLFRKGQRWPRPGKISVWFGPTIQPPVLGPEDDRYAAFCALAAQTQAAVEELARQAQAS
jgi:long-chain acyl-CoA synthetase